MNDDLFIFRLASPAGVTPIPEVTQEESHQLVAASPQSSKTYTIDSHTANIASHSIEDVDLLFAELGDLHILRQSKASI